MRRVSQWMCSVAIGCLIAGPATSANAQQMRGIVSDSASRRPIPGAVLILLDSTGATLGRNITNERGEFVLAGAAQARRVRLQRIGFRLREVTIPPAVNGVAEINVAMIAIPTFLEPVRVTASQCARRSDHGSAITLLEQARAGLLTTVVAREAKPASMVLFRFQRLLEGMTDKIDSQAVRVDSGYRSAVSFSAAHDAAEFVRRGFMQTAADGVTFFGPDADVLLDDRFSNGYCFRVMEPNRARPNQVGLGFVAADKQRDRVDIDGALWIDTVARALRDIEFRYVGLDPGIERFDPGGRIAFREMSNGTVLVDRWSLRIIGAKNDTINDTRSRTQVANVQTSFYASETGGELGHAVWRDGTAWHAPLGVVDIRAVRRDRSPARGVELGAPGSPYRATADSTGRVVLRDLVPGPYSIVAFDPMLAALDLTIPAGRRFTSNRDSSAVMTSVPTLGEFIFDRCQAERTSRSSSLGSTLVIGRMMNGDDKPVAGVVWRATLFLTPSDPVVLREGGRTSGDGVIAICHPALAQRGVLEIVASKDNAPATIVRHTIRLGVNAIRVPIDSRPDRN
jgi:hypothetical protein